MTKWNANAQNNRQDAGKKTMATLDVTGMIAMGYTQIAQQTNLLINFGGPCIKFGSNKIAISTGLFSSLRYNLTGNSKEDKNHLTLQAGTGIQMLCRHLVMGCLFCAAKENWYTAPMIGYRFN